MTKRKRKAFTNSDWHSREFFGANEGQLPGPQSDLRLAMIDGEQTTCPCCNQTVKLWPRSINASMVRSLEHLYTAGREGLASLTLAKLGDRGQVSKMMMWSLVVQTKVTHREGEFAGWRITTKGQLFLEGRHSVPKYALVYNDTVFGFSMDVVRIEDVAYEGFNKPELFAQGTVTTNEWI